MHAYYPTIVLPKSPKGQIYGTRVIVVVVLRTRAGCAAAAAGGGVPDIMIFD